MSRLFRQTEKSKQAGGPAAEEELFGGDQQMRMLMQRKILRSAEAEEEAEPEAEQGELEGEGELEAAEPEADAEEQDAEAEGGDEEAAAPTGEAPASEEALAGGDAGIEEESEAPVALKINRKENAAAPAPATSDKPKSWTPADLEKIQTELKRLGKYDKTIDGKWGNGTRTGLTAIYGGTQWQVLAAAVVVGRLTAQKDQPAQPGKPAAGAKGAPAGWTKQHITQMQTEMERLGLYRKTIDGKWGRGTEGALVESFGSEEWKTLDADSALARLKAAKPPAGKKGERNLQYGQMFKDGVLDMTLGVGFDEGGAHQQAIEAFTNVLGAQNFAENRGAAAKIYQQAGRELGESAFGKFFVRQNALTFSPPAGPPRQIHAVIRLVDNGEGDKGGEAAGAFKEGMAESDVSYYSGHGRYGSGPDFDRNFAKFTLMDGGGEVEGQLDDYEELEKQLKDEGKKTGRDPWSQFLWRVEKKRIDVDLSNAGNVFLNPQNKHPGEFGGKLIYWAMQQKGGGASPVTGKGGELDQAQEKQQQEEKERQYRLMVFDGCRTQDYNTAIRGTPGMDAQGADVLNTKRTLNWGDEAKTLAVFLESVLGQQSADKIVKDMDAQQSSSDGSGVGNAYQGSGLEDNPVFK